MLQFIAEDQEARKKVFFKPQLSSEIKFTHMIQPQFINDTTLVYMSAYDFISYDTDQQSFSLIHRPLPPDNELKTTTQQFINVNFGRDSRDKANEIFYLTKTTTPEQQCYYLGRRVNAMSQDNERRLIARNKKQKKKKYTMADLDNRGNVRFNVPEEEEVPNYVVQFKKEFIVKPSAGLVVFVVKKEQRQPEIKLSTKRIPQKQIEPNDNEEFNEDQDQQNMTENDEQSPSSSHIQTQSSQKQPPSNPSPPSSQQVLEQQTKQTIKQKQYKNHLLIHSFNHNQTMTFELDQSIESAFQVSENSPNIVCVTQKNVYLINFEVKTNYSKVEGSTSNFDLGNVNTYQNSKRGYLNSDIKVQILDKFQLQFVIKTEGRLPTNLCRPRFGQRHHDSMNGEKKKGRRNQSISHNSIVKDKRVSQMMKQMQPTCSKPPQSGFKKDKKSCIVSPSATSNTKQAITKNSRFAQLSNNTPQPTLYQQQQPYQEMKVIKKAFKILPISVYNQEFIMIVYVISKVLCSPDTIETLSFSYETTFLALTGIEFEEIDVTEKFTISNSNPIGQNSFTTNGNSFHRSHFNVEDNSHDFSNIFQNVMELGDIIVNKGVILIWEKNQPIVHEIAFKVDYRTSEMLDLSQPKNLKTQKSLGSSVNYLLEYRNKITLHLNSNLIRQIIISPNSQNFMIITGRNSANNNYRDSQLEYADTKPQDLDEKYDVANYLIFQYDLFNELWSSDANVYLKYIPLSYHKRRVDEITPFRMKNQVLALTGKKVHQMHKSLLDGILCFDLHPYGYYIAVSFGFNAKIYSLQHSRLNLIYTYNSQNIKKLKYSPNGSDLIIMSQKNIKILDAYSFSIKYILQEKSTQCSYTNFSYSFSGMEFITVYDNVFINIYDGLSYTKTGAIKPGQSPLLSFHDRIVTVIPDSQQKFVMALLQNGKLYFKWHQDVITIQHERLFVYQDLKPIKTIHYDSRRGVMFCGMENGVVRSHIWPIKNEASYNFNTYSEFKFSYNEISCLNTSFLTNTLYIGDINGNLTTAKFIVEKQKKITGELRPTNYYIFSTHSPLVNMPRTQLQALEKCYKYVLSSNSTSMVQNPQKLKLQYKLNEIITRMNEQMKRFKSNMREKLIEKESLAKGKLNFSKLYNQTKDRLCEVNHQIKEVKDRQEEDKLAMSVQYEQNLKKVIQEQNELIKEKGLQLSKNFMAKALLRQMHMNQLNQLKDKQQKVQYEYSAQGLKGLQLMMRQQELVPFDQIDYLPNQRIDVKKQLIQKLDADLKREQQRNYELKQQCTYMQNSKNNLQTGQIKEQTVIFRINLELQQMQTKLEYQRGVYNTLAQQLRQAQTKINRIQQNVIQRNPQFTKVVNGSSQGDDACNYKIWVKDKMSQEVQLLFNHYVVLGEIMEQKQLDIVEMVGYRKKCNDALEGCKVKKQKLKGYLHYLRDYVSIVKNKRNQLKFNCQRHELLQAKKKEKVTRKQQLQKAKINEDSFQESKPTNPAQSSQNKTNKNKSNSKIKDHHKLNATQINSSRATPTQNQQQNLIQQTQQAHSILIRRCSNIQNLPKDLIIEEMEKYSQTRKSKKQISPQMRKKMQKIVKDIDQKVKNQWANLEAEKLNPSTATPFRTSTNNNNCLSKRVRKLKSQVKTVTPPMSFAEKLVERMKEKQQAEKENNFFCQDSAKKQPNKIDKIIPFSATSSPIAKQIASHFNLHEKCSKFLKNNVKIQQRKVKRLNGQKAELLSEYQQLKYENKQLSDDQAMVKEGIDVFNQMMIKATQTGEYFFNDKENGVKTIRKTPFQKYIEQRSYKMSPNKTSTNFKEIKESFIVMRAKRGQSSRNSRINLNMTSTAFSSPKIESSPRKLTERMFRKY